MVRKNGNNFDKGKRQHDFVYTDDFYNHCKNC